MIGWHGRAQHGGSGIHYHLDTVRVRRLGGNSLLLRRSITLAHWDFITIAKFNRTKVLQPILWRRNFYFREYCTYSTTSHFLNYIRYQKLVLRMCTIFALHCGWRSKMWSWFQGFGPLCIRNTCSSGGISIIQFAAITYLYTLWCRAFWEERRGWKEG